MALWYKVLSVVITVWEVPMAKWMTRIGRALVMGLAWAVVWVPLGVVAGALSVGET